MATATKRKPGTKSAKTRKTRKASVNKRMHTKWNKFVHEFQVWSTVGFWALILGYGLQNGWFF